MAHLIMHYAKCSATIARLITLVHIPESLLNSQTTQIEVEILKRTFGLETTWPVLELFMLKKWPTCVKKCARLHNVACKFHCSIYSLMLVHKIIHSFPSLDFHLKFKCPNCQYDIINKFQLLLFKSRLCDCTDTQTHKHTDTQTHKLIIITSLLRPHVQRLIKEIDGRQQIKLCVQWCSWIEFSQ